MNPTIQVVIGLIAVLVVILARRKNNGVQWLLQRLVDKKPAYDLGQVSPVPATFDLGAAEPAAYRPFKSVYHLTMGIKKLPRQDWLELDKLYFDDVRTNAKVLSQQPDGTCFADDSKKTREALCELYNYVFTTLCEKYPSQFQMSADNFTNAVLSTKLTRDLKKFTGRQLLQTLVQNTPEDFLLLEYDPKVEEYVLKASSGIAANGFAVDKKMGLKLTDIHGPVPGYRQKLQMSMNRFFRKIVPGEFIERLTWGIQMSTNGETELFKPVGIHLRPGDEVPQAVDVDIARVANMRLERQVLTRLPQSGMLAFSVRTYMYPLETIKREGYGSIMADNIEAWPEEFAYYKSRPVWGKGVLSYLRSP